MMYHHVSTHLVAFFLLNFIVRVEANAAVSSSLKKIKKGTYEENLAAYRVGFCKRPKAPQKAPSVPLICPLDQVTHLAKRLAARKAAYEHMNQIKGHTIQLYMGSSRTAALKAQDLASSFTYPSKLYYRQPHYTVQLGFFADRLEAYFVYLTLIKQIPGAMIRPCMRTRKDYVAATLQSHGPVLSEPMTGGLS